MYASAMKCCGAMELCSVGFPEEKSFEDQLPEVWAQMKAQNAGILISIIREERPKDADNLTNAGFTRLLRFHNPRTGHQLGLWVHVPGVERAPQA